MGKEVREEVHYHDSLADETWRNHPELFSGVTRLKKLCEGFVGSPAILTVLEREGED